MSQPAVPAPTQDPSTAVPPAQAPQPVAPTPQVAAPPPPVTASPVVDPRLEATQAELATAKAALAEAKRIADEAAAAKLREAGDFKTLAERLESEKRAMQEEHQRTIRTVAINSALEKRLVAMGFDPLVAEDVANMIPSDQIQVDATGRVRGADAAIEAHRASRPSIYKLITPPAPVVQTPAPIPASMPTPPADPRALARTLFPATPPAAAPSGDNPAPSGDSRIDVLSMSPQDYAKYKRDLVRGVSRNGGARLRAVQRRTA